MADSFVFSKITPLNSIVNPDTAKEDYLDLQSAFSFFDFLKYINQNLSPLQANSLYVEYLKEWNIIKQNSKIVLNQTIKERYVEFLKELTLNYTTSEEKRFLSNIDFTDETEIDIIIPFYTKKINDICKFYSEKREKLKFKNEKNKIKGTSNSIEKLLYESITDVVFSDILDVSTYQKQIDYDEIIKNLNIEIEELYDLYTNYLDNDPDESYELYDVKTELRQKLYTSNINDIDANIFINVDESIKNQIFEDIRVFLTEFGRIFTINYDVTQVDLNCKPDEKLYNLVSDKKPKARRIVELKNKLIKKYIGVDFYYITTGTTITDVTSSILFKADNPSGNLLNRHFPTTASVEEESDLQSLRRIGLFFTPEKNSILYFSVPEKKYIIDETKLKPDSLYIFPDPELYGNTLGLTRKYNSDYPLIHIEDYTKSVKNFDCFSTEGDINTNPYTQDFYAYFSRNQINDNFKLGKDGLKTNFSSLYNQGILIKWTTDIYGNQFGLFKDKTKRNLKQNTTTLNLSTLILEDYDGGPIKFYENGFLPEVVFANNKEWVKPNIWASNYYYNLLIEGGISKIENGLMERGLYLGGYVVDGLSINRSTLNANIFDININSLSALSLNIIDGKTYTTETSTLEWDLNSNIINFTIDPDYILDGLYYNRSPSNFIPPPTKILDGSPDIGNAFKSSFENNYILSSIKHKEFDGGKLTDNFDELYNFENQTRFLVEQTLNETRTITSASVVAENYNYFNIKNTIGNLYVRDIISGEVKTLSSGLFEQFKTKYNSFIEEIYNEIIDFNIHNDFLWIRTPNNIVFEKLYYEIDKFKYSGSGENYIKFNYNNFFVDISNPFIFDNRNYCMLGMLSAINTNSNNFSIIPIFYKVNYNDARIYKITSNSLSGLYLNNSELNSIKIKRINKPVLTYNSRNEKYCLITTIEDQNELIYVYAIKFDYDGINILNEDIKLYNYSSDNYIKTINFFDTPTLSGNKIIVNDINNSNITFNQNEGELILN